MTKKILILGGNGVLGADLVRFLGDDHETVAITRENYQEYIGQSCDVLINANGNSRRFWANQNVLADFEASTFSVYRSLFDFKFEKYIYISSSDAYPDHGNASVAVETTTINGSGLCAYGFHKYLSEQIVKHQAGHYLILRCSLMLGSTLKKGPIFDLLNGNQLFITPDTRLQMITTDAVAGVISALLEKGSDGEIFNVGGTGTVKFAEINKYIKADPVYSPEGETQLYEMNVEKISRVYPVKSSEDYLKQFINSNHKQYAV